MDDGAEPAPAQSGRARHAVQSGAHWAGYGWYMTFGTFIPLFIFLAGYVVHLTLIGAPLARWIYRLGIWTSTLGQDPPGKDKVEARISGKGKKPFYERVLPYSPPGWLERRGRPVHSGMRMVWFLLVGWWLGAVWVVISWSPFLLPYPLFDVVEGLLAEVPSVMTLAWPARTPPPA